MGTKSMMGPEWEPAGVISRKIAELLTKEKGQNALPSPHARAGASSSLATAGQMMASPVQERQAEVANTRGLAVRPPNVHMPASGHQIDWQQMARIPDAPNRYAAPMTKSVSAPCLPPKDDIQRYKPLPKPQDFPPDLLQLPKPYRCLPESRASPVDEKAFPRRMVLGTGPSPTNGWYPGLEYTAKLGRLPNGQKPALF